jgi:hypothetical protein
LRCSDQKSFPCCLTKNWHGLVQALITREELLFMTNESLEEVEERWESSLEQRLLV